MQIVNQPTLPDPELSLMTIATPAVATSANANTSRVRVRNSGTAAATPINTPGMASAGLNGILMNSPSTISVVNAVRLSHRDKPVSATSPFVSCLANTSPILPSAAARMPDPTAVGNRWPTPDSGRGGSRRRADRSVEVSRRADGTRVTAQTGGPRGSMPPPQGPRQL